MKSSIITTTSDSISSGGTITGDLTIEENLTVSGDLTVSGGGSLSFDEVLEGTLGVTGAVTVGSDGSGSDVIFHSGTAGDNLTWDASEEVLQITGTNGATALDVLDGDVRVVDTLYFYDRGGESISSDGTDLTIAAGTALNITADVIDLSDATKDITLNAAVDALNFDSNTLSIDASNNLVGIGTAAPGDYNASMNNLVVYETGGNAGISIITDNNLSGYLAFGDGTGSNTYRGIIYYDHSTDAMSFGTEWAGTGATVDMSISSAGNVTINDNTASSATEGGSLRLQSNDGAVMASGHRLGVLEFAGAEDTSNTIAVGARIEAVTDDTWSASENGAHLDFYTVNGEVTSKSIEISAVGKVKIEAGSDFAAQTGGMVEMKDGGGYDPVLYVYSARESSAYSAARFRAGANSPSSAGDCVYVDFYDGTDNHRGGIQSGSTANNPEFFNGTSDERLKEDIIDTETNGLHILNGLELKDFTMKAWYSGRAEKVTCDFVAQNAEEYFPPMVSEHLALPKEEYRQDWIDAGLEEVALETADGVENKFKVKTVSSGSLIPILVKAVQELSAKVTALENA